MASAIKGELPALLCLLDGDFAHPQRDCQEVEIFGNGFELIAGMQIDGGFQLALGVGMHPGAQPLERHTDPTPTRPAGERHCQ